MRLADHLENCSRMAMTVKETFSSGADPQDVVPCVVAVRADHPVASITVSTTDTTQLVAAASVIASGYDADILVITGEMHSHDRFGGLRVAMIVLAANRAGDLLTRLMPFDAGLGDAWVSWRHGEFTTSPDMDGPLADALRDIMARPGSSTTFPDVDNPEFDRVGRDLAASAYLMARYSCVVHLFGAEGDDERTAKLMALKGQYVELLGELGDTD